MRFALVNPSWNFEGSIYFGCREPHLPLEFGYSKFLLEQAGHTCAIFDGQLDVLLSSDLVHEVEVFRPDFIVMTTAPSYLFWRCPPPEIRIPIDLAKKLKPLGAQLVIVGPHGSTTPRAVLQKTAADFVVLGECEEILPLIAAQGHAAPSIAYRGPNGIVVQGPNCAADMKELPALAWPDASVARHRHHHHRFDSEQRGPGVEMEASRGCPYHCTFCAKDNFRNNYRKRPLPVILTELDRFVAQGVEYIYFIDEIFLPDKALLTSLADRKVKIGIQTRLDLWSEEAITDLSRAGCVSIEAGVESITEEGRAFLDKKCKMSTEELTSRLVFARQVIPFVQANLLAMEADDEATVEAWRKNLEQHGVWANKPVPLFPYPGSPEYTRMWGAPDDLAWERAHEAYLNGFSSFSDIQEQRPGSLVTLEAYQSSGASRWSDRPIERLLITADAVGGVWQYTLDLCSELSRRGIRILVATLGPTPSDAQRSQIEQLPGVQLAVSTLRLEWMPQAHEDLAPALEWLLMLEREFHPDVIHLNGFSHADAPWNAPTLAVAHSCVFSWWKAVHPHEHASSDWDAYRRAVENGLRAASLVVAPTSFMRDEVVAEYRVPFEKTRVIHNFSLTESVHTGQKQDYVLAVGRVWDEAKNISLLDRVASSLAWPVRIAGETAQLSETRLGRLSHAEVRDQMTAAAIFAHPALYEPFGLAVLEAARAGCCLLLADIPSLRELWDEAALFLDPRDDAAWARELNRLITNPNLRAYWSSRALVAAGRFSASSSIDLYCDVYQSLAARRKAGVAA